MNIFGKGCAVAALALTLPMTAISSGQAAPLAPATSSALTTGQVDGTHGLVTDVQWRRGGGWHGGYRRGGWGGRGAGIGLGLAAGALLGGAIAAGSSPYYYGYGPGYYAPPPAYAVPEPDDDAVAYCSQRFKSYDPASGTYLGYDGARHPCP